MKKLISLLLVLILICTMLIGCEKKDPDTKIKEAFLFHFGTQGKTADDVIIEFDAGTYNGARVVMLDAYEHEAEERLDHLTDNAVIKYYDTNKIYVYKYGFFFTLHTALFLDILTEEDLEDIASKYNESITSYTDVYDTHDFDNNNISTAQYSIDE